MKVSMQYLRAAIGGGLIAVLLFTQTAIAQEPSTQAAQTAPQSTQTTPAPIERQTPTAGPSGNNPLSPEAAARARLLSAHTLYLAKTTQDASFPASPDDAYNLVLADLKNWGHYQIVDNIAQADLVLQLRDAVHTSVVDDVNDTGSSVYYLPSFQLTIADPSTLSPIWTVSVSVPTTLKSSHEPALVSAAAENLVAQLKLLVGDPLTAQDRAAAKQVTHYYHSHVAFAVVFIAAGTALSVALFFIIRHHMQQNAASFCQQHGISPCPGA